MTPVGVVIPSYNHEAYVADAVRSVLTQTYEQIELVVVDDGSSDESVQRINETIAEFPNRRAMLITQANAGAHAAIARGLAALNTPLCAVLNSDDCYETHRFQEIVPAIEASAQHTHYAIAFSGLSLMDGAGNELDHGHGWSRWYREALAAASNEPTIGYGILTHNFSVTSGNFVFTRALYDALNGFRQQKFAHDWDFLLRATALTEPIFIQAPLMRYRVHDSNTTETVRSLLKEECEQAVGAYIEMVRNGASNTACPCPDHWPAYWDRFVATRRAFWDTRSKLHPIGARFAAENYAE